MKKNLLFFILIISCIIIPILNLIKTNCKTQAIERGQEEIISLSMAVGNGKVIQSVDFVVNSSKFKNEFLKERNQFISNLCLQIENIRKEFLLYLSMKYIQNPIEEFKINNELKISKIYYNEKYDSVGFYILFDSINCWDYYHQSSISAPIKNKGVFLVKKKTSKMTNPFLFQLATKDGGHDTIANHYKMAYLKALEGLKCKEKFIKSYDPYFQFSYISGYTKLHSNAKDVFDDENGLRHHVWNFKEKELSNNTNIILYFYIINVALWYILILIISFLILIILLIIFKLKNKKNIKK